MLRKGALKFWLRASKEAVLKRDGLAFSTDGANPQGK